MEYDYGALVAMTPTDENQGTRSETHPSAALSTKNLQRSGSKIC